MQNHLLQIVCLFAMEKPASLEAEDIRNEKVKVLKAIQPLELDDVVIGQYTASADPKIDDAKYTYCCLYLEVKRFPRSVFRVFSKK